MLLSDFFTVALIPVLINTTSTSPDGDGRVSNVPQYNTRTALNSRRLPDPPSVEESVMFEDDFFTRSSSPALSQSPSAIRRPQTTDPILREIYEEEKHLNLDRNDKFDMTSEEARELIRSQRIKIQREQEELARQMAATRRTLPINPTSRGRSMSHPSDRETGGNRGPETSGYPEPTMFPILTPTPTPEEESTSTTTASPPSVGKLGIGGVFGKIKNKVDSAVGTFTGIFRGSSNKGTTTTTTTAVPPSNYPPPPPSSNNDVIFPDDDKENSYYPFPQPTPPPYYPGSESNSNYPFPQPTPPPYYPDSRYTNFPQPTQSPPPYYPDSRGNSNYPYPQPTPPPYYPHESGSNSNYPYPQPTPPPYYPETGSNSLVFGEDDPYTTVGTTRAPTAQELNCTATQTVYDGECYNVLQQLPCPPGQWLIEDDDTGRGKCVENKCAHEDKTAFFGGKCVKVRGDGYCHKGMVPYIFKNGEVECDCKELYLFNVKDGSCYPAYHRGPCDAGEIFTTRISPKGTLPPSCVKNKCNKDGYFCNAPSCPKDRNCVALKSSCGEGKGVWEIHPERLKPECIDNDLWRPDRIIGNVPTLACAPGSRRDILGTCRKPSRISFS